jgi:sulfate transport system ATP-binding protein
VSIVLDHVSKRYDGHPVVNQVSLEIPDGELFVLLGPSGSGKSTVLRMIAGLAEAEDGRILLHGRDVTSLSPQLRGVGLVFQHYALFRHMTVAENIEFPLRVRHVSRGERRKRRDELLELVGLAGLGARRPDEMSGGQQQRVALARALAHRPEVLLLDEPFGALDAKIRGDLRQAIRAIQRELRVTTIFVTHDQEEAFALSDRLGIMNFGRLLEVGPPRELYLRPQTEFVATFLGTANLMVGECDASGVRLGPLRFPLATEIAASGEARRVQVLFRPEDVAVKDSEDALSQAPLGVARVEEASFSGSIERLRLRLPALPGVRTISPPVPYGSDSLVVEATRSQHQAVRFPLRAGDTAWVGVRRLHALTHPGLSLLLLTDGSAAAAGALDLGSQIARLAHARVTLLANGIPEGAASAFLQAARERLGSGLAAIESRSTEGPLAVAVAEEATRQHYDLVVQGAHGDRAATAERIMQAGDHHLLLVPGPGAVPSRVLVCVAVGEPGKEDVRFAGRLVRHLGAAVTLLTVVEASASDAEVERAERFLAAGLRTLGGIGVPAQSAVRRGPAMPEILREIEVGGHDLLVLGTPLESRPGRVLLEGLVGELLGQALSLPVLLVRTRPVAERG